jgi:hypothetical protein
VSGVSVLTPDDLDLNDRPAAQTLYGFAGFPGDENMPLPEYKLLRKSYYYGGQPAEEKDYQFLGVLPETHFVMKFERGQMVDRSGAVVAVPEPGGMSGGPVWKLGTFQEVDSGAARKKVIGITIEWWENRNILVGVRIGVAVEAMRQTLPKLASHLPETRYLKVNVDLKAPQTA